MTLRAFKHFIDTGWTSERAEEMAAQSADDPLATELAP